MNDTARGIEDGEDVALAFEPEEEEAPLPPLARLGRYELLGRVAVGGMAEIFLARERSRIVGGSRQVALKIIRPQLESDATFRTMFLHESRVALRLSHPNICHVYECGVAFGRCFLAMEHVRGVTLRELSRQAAIVLRPIPYPVVAKIGALVAEALHAAHLAKDASGRPLGVVHRDVSPQNVMIGFDGVVKLLDFGVAHAHTELAVETDGTVKGKLGYLAPEQCLGRPVDARTDVFALGVCLWELLTGRRLYKRSADAEALAEVAHEDAPDAHEVCPEVPDELARIVGRALARSPSHRFATAAEMQHALELFLTERRELVNATRIANVVEHLFGGEPRVELDRSPEVVAWIPSEDDADEDARAPRSWGWWLAAPVALLLALAALGWALHDPSSVATASVEPRADASSVSLAPVPEPPPAVEPRVVTTIVEVPIASPLPAPPRRGARREQRRPPPAPGGLVEDPGF